MIHDVAFFKEPMEIQSKLSEMSSEMTEYQLAFLCGLIKKYRPAKIVEVGVAAGGTTAILLNCISMLGLDTEMYSVDISENYYKDRSKKTGYLAEESKKFLSKEVRHKSYRGEVLAKFIEEIGDGIDLLILDTEHRCPGEILDFLACFPKLKKGAIVVLHDIILNHLSTDPQSYATKLLLCSATGERILCGQDSELYDASGIGAFQITEDTEKYIENVFSSLTITWSYMPDYEQLKLYRKCFLNYYDERLIKEFDYTIEMNRATLQTNEKIKYQRRSEVSKLIHELRGRKNIFIYGCGVYGMKLRELLEWFEIKPVGYVISDGQTKPSINEKVEFISDIKPEDSTIVLGMSIKTQKELCKDSKPSNWICINEHIVDFLYDYF